MKLFSYTLCIIALLSLFGCGSSSSSGSGDISVETSPTSATVATLSTQQFTAKLKNTANTNVTWQVNGVNGGDTTYGTITGTGLYTAPSSVPSSAGVTITAISLADRTKTAEASVTIALPISVSPSTTSVSVTSTQQFTASVTFSTETGVTWQVNGVSGGNSTVGTIDSAGLYTAPSTVPTPNTVTVKAVAKADTTRTATATLTVAPAAIEVSPSDAVVSAGGQQTYTAEVLDSSIQPDWSVTCASAVLGACGSINSAGTYTAPLAPPPGGKVKIMARMADGSATIGSVNATIQFGNATLAGTYIFSLADDVGHKSPSQAGALVFDGSGHISGGLIDSTDTPGTPQAVTGGTYTVGTDGRGTASVQTATGSLSLQLVLSNHARGFLVRTDSAANQAAGTLDLQQTVSGAPALDGAYALSVFGVTTDGGSSALLSEAGSIRVSSSTGVVSGGVIDINKELALQTVNVTSGYATQPSNGYRGTLSFATTAGTQTFAYYPVDGKRIKVVGIDGTFAGIGDLYLQPQGPFSSSTLKGRYVFSLAGAKTGVPFGVAGVFSLDGAGSVTDLLFDGISQTVFDFKPGAYTVTDAQTGRTTATWTGNGGSTLQCVLYPRSDGGIVLFASDGVYLGTGVALPQADTWLYNTLQNAFALSLGGSDASTSSSAERVTARIVSSTTTALSGTADGTITGQGSALTLNLVNQNSTAHRYTYGISSDKLTGSAIVVYRIDDDRSFIIKVDDTRVMTGVLERQY